MPPPAPLLLLLPPQSPTGAEGDGLAQRANHWIDTFVETCNRLLELPVAVLLVAVAALAGLGALWLHRRARRGKPIAALRFCLTLGALALGMLIVDQKIAALQDAFADLRAQTRASLQAVLAGGGRALPSRQTPLYDTAAAERELGKALGKVTTTARVIDDATDLVQLTAGEVPIVALLAIVDLRRPGVGIEIGATLDEKTLTSAFARQRGCTIAINGEAGNSGRPGSGLGRWQGHLMRAGEVLLTEQPDNPRPFLAFARDHRAAYVSPTVPSRGLPAVAHDAIWGRVDALLGGVPVIEDFRSRQPRTAMAIDQAGERLYLLVADGRQPKSRGMTRAEVGQTLAAFGAHDGMLCDEGGSSCMFLEVFGGIANVPSDRMGQERPTYTHFGITYRSGR